MKHNTLIIGINTCDYGSTGTIMRNTLEYATLNSDYDYYIFVPHSLNKQNSYGYCDNIIIKIFNRIENKLFKKPEGFKFYASTFNLLRKIKKISKKYNRCIIHFHNLHECYLNIPILFRSLSKNKKFKFCLTLHDSWIFTGGCYCFNYIKCFRWYSGCINDCPQNIGIKKYTPNKIFEEKVKAFKLIVDRLTIIVLSKWMAANIKQSFLKDCKIYFNPGECNIEPLKNKDNSLIEKYNLINKKIVLMISAYWNDWKGYKYIYEVANNLPQEYVILVIGGEFDTKHYRNIIHVKNVNNFELNSYYSIANVFVSVTQDDNCPLVIMEAQICGVPIVGFGHGGTKEMIVEGKSGFMVGTENNVELLVNKIIDVCEKQLFFKKDIINNGLKFKRNQHAKRQLNIYNQMIS